MRAYTVATAAVTLGMPVKWLDNVLSQNQIDGVVRLRQGVSRRLTPRAMLVLDIAVRLIRTFSVPVPVALSLAARLMREGNDQDGIDAGDGLVISIDIHRIEADLMDRLAHAVEIAPSPRRGRPPRKG